jgi:hypothetical protein
MAETKAETPPHVEVREVAIAKLPLENPDNVKPVYCNSAQVAMTNWDIRLLFSELIVLPPDNLSNNLRANVVMTPSHAKALAKLMNDQIAKFEELHGEIAWPPKETKKGTKVKSEGQPHSQLH